MLFVTLRNHNSLTIEETIIITLERAKRFRVFDISRKTVPTINNTDTEEMSPYFMVPWSPFEVQAVTLACRVLCTAPSDASVNNVEGSTSTSR